MNLLAKKYATLISATSLLTCVTTASAVPIDNVPGANATLQSLGTFIVDYLGDYASPPNDIGVTEQELLDLCNDYDAAANSVNSTNTQGLADLRNLLDFIAHEEVGAVGSGFSDTRQDLVGNVLGRMQYLRSGAPSLASNSHLLWQTGGAAGDDFSRLSIYSNVSYGDGSKDRTRNEQGFDFDSQALTVGGDYRLSDNMVVGLALGYGQSDVDIDNGLGDNSSDTLSLTSYGSLYHDNWYMDASLGYAVHDYDNNRFIATTLIGSLVDQNLSSSTDGDSLSWSLGAGYSYVMYGWTADYSLHLDSVSASVDGYRESGGPLALDVGDQDVDSLQGILGVQFSKAYNTDFGVFMPSFGLEMHQEFDDDARVVTAQYVFDRFNNQFSFTSDDADENFYLLSAGASVVLSQGRQLFLNWDHLAGLSDVSSNTLAAGFRMEL